MCRHELAYKVNCVLEPYLVSSIYSVIMMHLCKTGINWDLEISVYKRFSILLLIFVVVVVVVVVMSLLGERGGG